jgi:hypothetical protein
MLNSFGQWMKTMRRSKIDKVGRVVSLIALLLALTCLVQPESSAIRVVDNPRSPKAKNAGRVIVPKEAMSISGKGHRDYSFKYPSSLRVMYDGSLLLIENVNGCTQVLLFGKDGRFLRNLVKKGNGPGEMGYPAGYFTSENKVIVLAKEPDKLLWFDSAGKYEREIPLPFDVASLIPLAFIDGAFYFQLNHFGFNSDRDVGLCGEFSIIDVPSDIYSFTEGSDALKLIASFPTKSFIACVGSDRVSCGTSGISRLTAVPYQAKYLALFHTSEYLLKIYDPSVNTVIREFRRSYKRVKAKRVRAEHEETIGEKTFTLMDNEMIIGGKICAMPDRNYKNDIVNILTRGDEVWAVTSIYDKAKGVLIDLFNGSGIYEDSFFLKLPESALVTLGDKRSTLDGNALYTICYPMNQDDACVIRKYLIDK